MVTILAAGGSKMSKRFWDPGVPKTIKKRRYTRTKALLLKVDSIL